MRVTKIKRSELIQIWHAMRMSGAVVSGFSDLERAADLIVGVEKDTEAVKETTTVGAEHASDTNELAPAPTSEEGARAHRRTIEFRERLRSAVNASSMEFGSDTPGFILAAFLAEVLEAFDRAMRARNVYYGKEKIKASTESEGPGVDNDLIQHARMIFREAMGRDANFEALTNARVVAVLLRHFRCLEANSAWRLATDILKALFEK